MNTYFTNTSMKGYMITVFRYWSLQWHYDWQKIRWKLLEFLTMIITRRASMTERI